MENNLYQSPVFTPEQLDQALMMFDELFLDSRFVENYILEKDTARDAWNDFKGINKGLQGQQLELVLRRRNEYATSESILARLETGLYSSLHKTHLKLRLSKLRDDILVIRLTSNIHPYSLGNLVPISIRLIDKKDPLFSFFANPDALLLGVSRERYEIPNPLLDYLKIFHSEDA